MCCKSQVPHLPYLCGVYRTGRCLNQCASCEAVGEGCILDAEVLVDVRKLGVFRSLDLPQRGMLDRRGCRHGE